MRKILKKIKKKQMMENKEAKENLIRETTGDDLLDAYNDCAVDTTSLFTNIDDFFDILTSQYNIFIFEKCRKNKRNIINKRRKR